MSTPHIPEPANLIISVLTSEGNMLGTVTQLLAEKVGPTEEVIGPLAFDYTKYYDDEMGPGIKRWLLFFTELLDGAELARIKCLTNQIEQSYSEKGKRRVNLDPGLMTLGNFVLATGKNNAHRIYLGAGIFADLTLIFRGGSYRPLEWTCPDYAGGELITLLNRLRKSYKCRLESQSFTSTSRV